MKQGGRRSRTHGVPKAPHLRATHQAPQQWIRASPAFGGGSFHPGADPRSRGRVAMLSDARRPGWTSTNFPPPSPFTGAEGSPKGVGRSPFGGLVFHFSFRPTQKGCFAGSTPRSPSLGEGPAPATESPQVDPNPRSGRPSQPPGR